MATIMPMMSMELDDDEQYDTVMPLGGDKPSYPYGLQICLTGAELEKLGLDPAAAMGAIGGMVHGHFMGQITSANMNAQAEGDPQCRIEIQIQFLAIESEDDENAEGDPVAKPRGLLYASSQT